VEQLAEAQQSLKDVTRERDDAISAYNELAEETKELRASLEGHSEEYKCVTY